MIVYLIVGTVLVGYIAYHLSTRGRRRWQRPGPDTPAGSLEPSDPLPGLLSDGNAHGHHHHDHAHGGDHGVDFDAGGGHHH